MPSATPELRARWWPDDDETGTQTATRFLEERGYRLDRAWMWVTPTPDHVITEDEDSAIVYLITEWDYGGVRRKGKGKLPFKKPI